MPAIVRLHLNRPEKRNALDRATILRLRQQIRDASQSEECRVVLLTGEGRDFCSGADLSELQRIRDSGASENFEDARLLAGLFHEMRHCPVPIIAAVQGRALAGGCGLATACDLIVASSDAQFGYPEVNIGFVPAMVMAILRRSVSEKFAFELLTTGRILPAAEALSIGLINAVCPPAELDSAAAEFVRKMSERPASAVRLTKHLLYHIDGMTFDAAVDAGAQINAIARMTTDCRSGIDRFLASKP